MAVLTAALSTPTISNASTDLNHDSAKEAFSELVANNQYILGRMTYTNLDGNMDDFILQKSTYGMMQMAHYSHRSHSSHSSHRSHSSHYSSR